MARAVARRGIPRGCTSRPFSAAAVLDALRRYDDRRVYVEPGEGRLAAAGADSLAAVAVRARLAPNHQARSAALALAPAPSAAPSAGAWLQLRAAADLAPHDELLLWPDDDLLARLAMPFLTLTNVLVSANSSTGGVSYACHLCQARFDQPHPLKVHLLLGCEPYCPHAFWHRVLLAANPPPAAAPRSAAPPAAPPPPPGVSPADLEALATAWGRVPAGHLCLYCGKVYSRRYGLKIHIRTHTGYKPLRCRHCARRFGDPSNLNKHVRLHASAPSAAPSPSRSPHRCARRHRRPKHPAPSPPPPGP